MCPNPISASNAASEAADGSSPLQASNQALTGDSYYSHHIFFCLNQRSSGETCCANHQAQAHFDHCKARVKALGLAGQGGVRVNKAGCLDRCAGGPVAVVYPQAVWYTFVDQADIDEIVESHLRKGQVVERLLLPDHVGR